MNNRVGAGLRHIHQQLPGNADGVAVAPDLDSAHVGTVLDRHGVAIRAGHHCTQPLMRALGVFGTARVSFYVYNTLEEVDVLVDALSRARAFFSNDTQ